MNFRIAVSGFEWSVGQEANVCCGWIHSQYSSGVGVIPSGDEKGQAPHCPSRTYPMETHKHMFIHITVHHRPHMCTHTFLLLLCAVYMSLVKVKTALYPGISPP